MVEPERQRRECHSVRAPVRVRPVLCTGVVWLCYSMLNGLVGAVVLGIVV